MTDDRSASPVHIACLCAAWCRVCEGYQAVFDEVRRGWTETGPWIQWHWIDIEDESERVGDLDIETFPMLLVADAQGVRFAGPVTPEAHTLRRLLKALLDAHEALPRRPPVPEAVAALGRRLCAGG
jgi:thioredoxin 1